MKEINKSWWTMLCSALIIIALLAALSGCASDTAIVDIGEKAVEKSTDRFANHSAIRAEEEATKRKIIELNIAELQVDAAYAQTKTITIDTPEKMAIAGMLEMGKAMSRAVVALAQRDGNPYKLATTPTPKGVIGESLESLGDAVTKVANSPGAIVAGVGWAVSRTAIAGFKAAGDTTGGDKTTITGDENTVSAERNPVTTTATTTGATSDATATANPASEAPVEEEVEEDPIVEEPVVTE